MKQIISLLILMLVIRTLEMAGQEYAIGADLSFLKSAEDKGFIFKENGAGIFWWKPATMGGRSSRDWVKGRPGENQFSILPISPSLLHF